VLRTIEGMDDDALPSLEELRQGLTLVHIRARLEQLQETFMS
jgi:hypothetical protein